MVPLLAILLLGFALAGSEITNSVENSIKDADIKGLKTLMTEHKEYLTDPVYEKSRYEKFKE